MDGWIKLDRRILDWGWYKDPNTKAVFIHLLLTANIEDREHMGEIVPRGSVAVNMGSIAESVGISYKSVRTALKRLETGNEVAIKRKPKHLEISITNYDKYQGAGRQRAIKGQSNGNQTAITNRYINNINNKEQERKKERREEYTSLGEVIEWDKIDALRKTGRKNDG